MEPGLGYTKSTNKSSRWGFADAFLCGKSDLMSLESQDSELLIVLLNCGGLKDHSLNPQSWVWLEGTEAPSTGQNNGQSCCLHY